MLTWKKCKARIRRTGTECPYPALPGRNFCRNHCRGKRQIDQPNLKRFGKMRYSKYIGEALSERVERLDSSKLACLRDELAIMRALACDSLALYDAASTIADPDGRTAAVMRAGELVKDAMREVRDMCIAAAKLEVEEAATIDAADMNVIVHQLTRIIDKVLYDYRDEMSIDPKTIADDIAKRFKHVKAERDMPEGVVSVDSLKLPLEDRKALLSAIRGQNGHQSV